MRRSKRPNKCLFWMYMNKVFKESKLFDVGLDVACGRMGMRPYFKTNKYIGLDLDEDRIKDGLKNNLNVVGRTKSIEQMNPDDRGDFVVCIQTIGINNYFEVDNTLLCIQKLIDSTNKKGGLVFNVGPKVVKKYITEIESMCFKKFEKIETKRYGRFNREVPISISIIIANLMRIVPFLKRSKKTPFCLFVCKGRR